MSLGDYFRYSSTQESREGLYVALTAVVLEIILLSIILPMAIRFHDRHRTRAVRYFAYFYLFQIFQDIARMLLDMASLSVREVSDICMEETRKNPRFRVYSDYSYGNLENILFVLRERVFGSEATRFQEKFRAKDRDALARYVKNAQGCLDEVDRLVAMLGLEPKSQTEMFMVRAVVYPFRDYLSDVLTSYEQGGKSCDIQGFSDPLRMGKMMTGFMDAMFTDRKRSIDSYNRRERRREVYRLLASVNA